MPKKNDVIKMKESLARLNERAKSTESELKRLEEKRKKVQNLIAEEERKKRTHNLCCVGGLVYKYFGDDILILSISLDTFSIQNFKKKMEPPFRSGTNIHSATLHGYLFHFGRRAIRRLIFVHHSISCA